MNVHQWNVTRRIFSQKKVQRRRILCYNFARAQKSIGNVGQLLFTSLQGLRMRNFLFRYCEKFNTITSYFELCLLCSQRCVTWKIPWFRVSFLNEIKHDSTTHFRHQLGYLPNKIICSESSVAFTRSTSRSFFLCRWRISSSTVVCAS